MSGYSDGRRVEYAAADYLRENGYEVTRAASSKGTADLICFKPGQALLVNVKRTTMPGPAERANLFRVASYLGGIGIPLVALKPLRAPLQFRRLTGPGPKDWTAWTPDDIEGAGARCPLCDRPVSASVDLQGGLTVTCYGDCGVLIAPARGVRLNPHTPLICDGYPYCEHVDGCTALRPTLAPTGGTA